MPIRHFDSRWLMAQRNATVLGPLTELLKYLPVKGVWFRRPVSRNSRTPGWASKACTGFAKSLPKNQPCRRWAAFPWNYANPSKTKSKHSSTLAQSGPGSKCPRIYKYIYRPLLSCTLGPTTFNPFLCFLDSRFSVKTNRFRSRTDDRLKEQQAGIITITRDARTWRLVTGVSAVESHPRICWIKCSISFTSTALNSCGRPIPPGLR